MVDVKHSRGSSVCDLKGADSRTPTGNSLSRSLLQIGKYAKEQSVSISILGTQGEDFGMAQVSISAEVSGGTVNILHPLEIVRQIRKIAQNPIVATEVEAVFISHPSVEVKGPRMSPVSLCLCTVACF